VGFDQESQKMVSRVQGLKRAILDEEGMKGTRWWWTIGYGGMK